MLLFVFIIFTFSIIVYGAFITFAIVGFNRLRFQEMVTPKTHAPTEIITIVISARNESANIAQCLAQFEKQDFPKNKFEIIIMDDASEDATYSVAKSYLEQSSLCFQIHQNQSHQGKKLNIANAISKANGSIIITTDADVLNRSSQYLKHVSAYFEKHEPAMLIMPIDFIEKKEILNAFQITENIALTGITSGFVGLQKPFLCNGANLAFDKKAYQSVNGYQSHLQISSGEDVFLLEDIKKMFLAQSIHYGFSRHFIAHTIAETSISSFLNQRLRWAYKAKYSPNWINSIIGLITIFVNVWPIVLCLALYYKSIITSYLVTFVMAKFIFDFLLLFLAADFLGRLKYIRWFIPFQLVYGFYALVVGVGSLFVKPKWKNKPIQ